MPAWRSSAKIRPAEARPADREALWLDVARRFGIALPHKVFTPGHSTPFDFVADAFFSPAQDLASWANRSGLKTLCASIIAALEFLYTERPIHGRVLSGSEDQATHLYSYWADWAHRILGDRLKGDTGKLLTRLENGTFQILAASQKRVRGGKVQRLYRDEIDEIPDEILSASIGMLDSRHGVPARSIDLSTWHYPHGPMGQLVEEAEERNIHLHKWNVWETIARCPPDRHLDGKGCVSCKLAAACVPKAQQHFHQPMRRLGIAADACGLIAIDDAIKQFSQWSAQEWDAEAECKRPSVAGLVYPTFSRAMHVRPDLDFSEELLTYRAIDWGLRDFICLWLQVDKNGVVYVVDEYWAKDATVAQNARHVAKLDEGSRVESTFCDPAGRNRNDQTGRSDIEVFNALAECQCRFALDSWAREVRNGINLIRSHLQPADGPPRLLVAGKCKQLIRAFESYRNRKVNNEWIDEPVKPQACDHPMDALRYFFTNRIRERHVVVKRLNYAPAFHY